VALAWLRQLFSADPLQLLDFKLRNVTRALQSWSATKIGSVRFQLALAREVVLRFDAAQDYRALTLQEAELRKSLKLRILGLASLARTIAGQKSRLLFLAEGDANTRFFHLQACHRKRKSRIDTLTVHGSELVRDDLMAQALFEHYSSILGSSFERSRRINLSAIGLPLLQLSGLEDLFTEDEVRSVVMDLPNDKASGLDGRPVLQEGVGHN
jgi:hypothetical protein